MIPLRALVIDDSRVMRAMVIRSLQATKLASFEFVEAEDGADALAKFDPAVIDICFVDWNMPNMTGIDFVNMARLRGDSAHVPMVMVTSERTVAKIDEALAGGAADGYICKPFTVQEMEVKLQKIVDRIEEHRASTTASGFLSKLFR